MCFFETDIVYAFIHIERRFFCFCRLETLRYCFLFEINPIGLITSQSKAQAQKCGINCWCQLYKHSFAQQIRSATLVGVRADCRPAVSLVRDACAVYSFLVWASGKYLAPSHWWLLAMWPANGMCGNRHCCVMLVFTVSVAGCNTWLQRTSTRDLGLYRIKWIVPTLSALRTVNWERSV